MEQVKTDTMRVAQRGHRVPWCRGETPQTNSAKFSRKSPLLGDSSVRVGTVPDGVNSPFLQAGGPSELRC